MVGPSKNTSVKGARRAADMSPRDASAVGWSRPPDSECVEDGPYTSEPPGAHPAEHQILVRFLRRSSDDALVEFAIVQRTKVGQEFTDVFEADSCHDEDVHCHRYARSTGERIGDPERLRLISSLAEVQDAYCEAHDFVFDNWLENVRRWNSA